MPPGLRASPRPRLARDARAGLPRRVGDVARGLLVDEDEIDAHAARPQERCAASASRRSGACGSCTRTSTIGSSPEMPRPQRRRLHGRPPASTVGRSPQRRIGEEERREEPLRRRAAAPGSSCARAGACGSPARRREAPSARRASSRSAARGRAPRCASARRVVTKASVTRPLRLELDAAP